MSAIHPLPVAQPMPHLSFEFDGAPRFAYPLRSGRTVLGRADSCDVALPSDQISRVHCFVEQRGDRWLIVDRSTNGTTLNGEPIDGRATLDHGDAIGIGDVVARFDLERSPAAASPTQLHRVSAAIHEEPVEIDPQGLTACRVVLRDADTGEAHELGRMRTTIGGAGADLCVDDQMPAWGCVVVVVRGRAMVEAGDVAAFVAGQRVRETVPVYPGETVRIGPKSFVVEQGFRRRGRSLDTFGQMVGSHPAMQQLFGTLEKAAAFDPPVLLVGESGTGKELAARALHDVGPRAEGPYIALNVAALSPNLFESELFGHEKGAFTGATSRQDGAFHRADQGTLFLDEIGELPLEMQAKLLRTLESGEVRRVGGAKVDYPDVRIVAATNRDLPAMVREGTFRADLYFRLCQLPIRLPPLRDRRSDIVPLAEALLARMRPGTSLTAGAAEVLEAHDWPGNVRELRNVLQRAVVMGGPVLHAETLAFEPDSFLGATGPELTGDDFHATEREAIRDAMHQCSGNKAKAARVLGMPRTTLAYKLRKLGLA